MGKTYEKAPPECCFVVGEILSKYHPQLADVGLAVDVLLVHAPRDADGHPTGPALQSKSGYPAAASVSVTKLKDRVLGRGDAEIILDGDRYPKWTPPILSAIVDHELEHLDYSGDTDDIGRPRLKLKPHDIEFGWFDAVARRHGDKSVEVLQAQKIFGCRSLRQLYLPGWEDAMPTHEADAVKPSISRDKAARHLSEAFTESLFDAGKVDPKSLTFAVVPIVTEGKATIVEAWVDQFDRAVIFTAGEIIETTPNFQLSARWAKGTENQ